MLAWRAFPQSASFLLRRPWQSTRISRYSSIPHSNSQLLRPQGIWGKLRYKKNGEPRSRLAGAAFGSLILFNALTLYTMSDFIEDSEVALGLLASVIYIQQADQTFSEVNFQDPLATLTYFKVLYQAFSRVPAEEVEELFKDLTRLMKLKNANVVEGEAHHIMRTAAQQVHLAFQKLDEDSISDTTNNLVSVMREALESLIGLVEDMEDDGSDSKYTFQLIRDHSKKDAGSVLKDYESLG